MSQMPPPGPPPQQPPPPQQQPSQSPMGWLRLELQGSAFTSSMITPTVTINGARMNVKYGENVIPVYAGPTRVDVSCQWLKEYGQATLETTVPEGQQVQVFYAAPLHQFSRGAIGYERQKRPGMAVFLAILAVIIVVVLALVILPAL